MHICFAVHSNHGAAILDPEYCEEHPVGGSETAVIKMAQFFRHLGIKASCQRTSMCSSPSER